MIRQAHALLQPLRNLLLSLDFRPRLPGGFDNCAVKRHFPNPHKRRDGHFEVALVTEPVGVNDGRVEHVGALDGHVATGGGRVERRADEEVVVVGANVGGDGGALETEEIDVGPVRGEGLEERLGGVAKDTLTEFGGDLFVAWGVLVYKSIDLSRSYGGVERLTNGLTCANGGERAGLLSEIFVGDFGENVWLVGNYLRVGLDIDLENVRLEGLVLEGC